MSLRRFRSALSYSLLAPAALVAPAPVFAVDYLTAEQADRLIFPSADRFEVKDLSLEEAERQALETRLGIPVRDRWPLRLARQGDRYLGAVAVDDVIGRFERITFAVGVGADGAVAQVEVLSYRESHGYEVRLPAWRKQFVGKTAASPLRVGEDISNISGATLSCKHLTLGVRRILAVVQALQASGALP
ncbi:MAG TPA: FMN-binding protein [Anaeromyxobacteraceae bacterium]|nr:FMN-binding protein [Anaeromyxobacteraceae bacterium]